MQRNPLLLPLLWALSLAGTFAAPALGADALAPPIYLIKQAEPSLGTHIARKVVYGSEVPINRRYSELTPEEQATVKSRYESMPPGDEPPYPARGLLPLFQALRDVTDKMYAEGEVVMFIEVDPSGDAIRASVIKSPDSKLTQVLAGLLMATKFKPATCGGAVCQMGFPFRMTFKIDH